MPSIPPSTSLQTRLACSLAESLGQVIADALSDASVVEVMVNPDGSLWVDRRGDGRCRVGSIAREEVEAVIRLVAAQSSCVVSRSDTSIAAMLPPLDQAGVSSTCPMRFQGMWPPTVPAPSFVIRKLGSMVWSLDDYRDAGIATAEQVAVIRDAIAGRENILVAGGTGSGKTTLLNACLAEPEFMNSRVFLLEDTPELDFRGEDCTRLIADFSNLMSSLLQSTLRLRPDRIVVGEVRGAEAYDTIRSWNVGHPGGICSLHANGLTEALTRFQDLACERAPTSERAIVDAVGLVVFVRRDAAHPAGRVLESVGRPTLDDHQRFSIEKIYSSPSVRS